MGNDLQLNASKSKVLEIGMEFWRKKIVYESPIIIAGASSLSAESVCSTCTLHTKALRRIRPFLDVQTAIIVIAFSTIGSTP